jgi:uncharacterized protein
MSRYARPRFRLVGEPTPESLPFWTGGERGELLVMRCHRCGHFFHPPAGVCWRCRSRDVAAEAVSGRGTVASYTVNRQPWIPGFEPPYVIVLVELAEERDVRVISNLVDVPIAESGARVEIGMAVEVFFEEWTPPGADSPVWVPLFRRARSGW